MRSYINPPNFKDIISDAATAKGIAKSAQENKAGRYSRQSLVDDKEIGYGIVVTNEKNEKNEKGVYAIFRQNPEEKDQENITKNKEIAQGNFGKIKFLQKTNGKEAKKVFVLKTTEVLDDSIGHADLLAIINNKSLSFQKGIDLEIIEEYFIDLFADREAFKAEKHTTVYSELIDKYGVEQEKVKEFKKDPKNLKQLKDIILPKYNLVKGLLDDEFANLEKLGRTRGGLWSRNTKRMGQKKYEFIMEYEPGKTLDHLSKEKLSPEEAKRAILLILANLKKMHDKNIIHVDIKGPNILFYLQRNKKGKVNAMRAALVDFGFSMQLKNKNGIIKDSYRGTIDYSAPEVTNKTPSHFSKKSDIYAMGVTLDEIFSQYFEGWDVVRIRKYFDKMKAYDRKQRPTVDEAIEYFNNFHIVHPLRQMLAGALLGGFILVTAAFSGVGIMALGFYAVAGALVGGAALGGLSAYSEFFEKHREIILVSLALSLLVVTGILSMGAVPAIAGVFAAIGSVFVSSAIPGLAATVGAGIVGSILPVFTTFCLGVYEFGKKLFAAKKEPVLPEPFPEEQRVDPIVDEKQAVPEEKAEQEREMKVELKPLKGSSGFMIETLSPIVEGVEISLSPEESKSGASFFSTGSTPSIGPVEKSVTISPKR